MHSVALSRREINHAGVGGLWVELVRNRGFEAGGPNTPSNIDPWSIIGDERSVLLVTDRSSIFERNKIALRMEVFCDNEGGNHCPKGGARVYNPGYWGMNIEEGESYHVVLWIMSTGLSITSSKKGIIWLDQVSAMPVNTFKGHRFRKELAEMLAVLKPQFIRFPGGCYVEEKPWL